MNYLYTNRRSVGIFGGLLLLILFSCCGIGRAAAQQQGAEQRITLSMRDTAISDILENITKRYQYAFITRTANVDTNARVSIDVVDEPLRAVLDRIFAGQEVAFEFDGRLVRISKAAVPPPLLRVDDRGFGRRARRVGQSAGGRYGHGGRNLQGRYHRQRRALCAACRRRGVGAAIPLSGL
ncbi:STN domain-containing protein [Alistipes communis]|uniref:STN domain-containing protein n=1 Tax=Alistipes communis TaxID=2585118 RepID=UPI002431D294|nr:STN domain-containing protein [Alistipes communis]